MSSRINKYTAKDYSASITLILCLISITPLCGYIFLCGCDWPWLGLDAKCNIHNTFEQHPCPWCISLLTGFLSSSLAIFAGVMAASNKLKFINFENTCNLALLRIIIGLFVFFIAAILLAELAAIRQDYPI